MKTEKEWLGFVEDLKKYYNNVITCSEMRETYPDFDFCGAIFTIPKECPLTCAAEIIFSCFSDTNIYSRVSINIIIPFQAEWKELPQIGRLYTACENESEISFSVYLRGDYIELRDCIAYGDRGDSDGYGMEPDTWLIGWLNRKGEWVEPFYIEK